MYRQKKQHMTTETKAGYKNTKLGWIPEEWKEALFQDVFSFIRTYSYSRSALRFVQSENDIRNIHYGDIHSKFTKNILSVIDSLDKIPSIGSPKDNYDLLQDGDLVIADASEDYEGVCASIELANVSSYKVTGGLHTFVARDNSNKSAIGFRSYFLRHKEVLREVKKIATGTSVYGVSKSNLKKVLLALPPLPEQKKIADILSTWDKAIETTQTLIEKLQLRKKGLMQQLLTGKKRLPGFSGEWEEHKMSEILISAGKRVETIPSEIYRQIGVRSHTKGIFYKHGVTGEKLGNKRVFWIEPDCFIVNIVFAWEHAIAKTTNAENGMIASHRFPMYKPKRDMMHLDFLLYYFKTPKGKHLLQLASPGGAGRNKTLGKTEFLRLQIPVPSLKEQIAIAQVLTNADEEIHQIQNYLEQLQAQKKGLMQQLLTGQKRVKV